jgi:hypothetical protein
MSDDPILHNDYGTLHQHLMKRHEGRSVDPYKPTTTKVRRPEVNSRLLLTTLVGRHFKIEQLFAFYSCICETWTCWHV